MCVRYCEFWTFRVILFFVSTVSVVISFLMGPLHTIFIVAGVRKDLPQYFEKEFNYALLLCFLLTIAWIIFISNSILFIACFSKSRLLLDMFVCLTILNMVFSFGVAIRYLIHCTLIDTNCFDHSKNRTTDDKGGALGLFAADLLYLVACVLMLFMVCSYKLALR